MVRSSFLDGVDIPLYKDKTPNSRDPYGLTGAYSLSRRYRRFLRSYKPILLFAAAVSGLYWLFFWGGNGQMPLKGNNSAQFGTKRKFADRVTWDAKAEQVKDAFVHAWRGYSQYASPDDELLPLSNKSTNNFNGWGVSLVDGLSTMLLMGLEPKYHDRVLEDIRAIDIKHSKIDIGFFETVIRYLGGFLSAYALTNDTVYMRQAHQLGRAVLPAFQTQSGLPATGVYLSTKQPKQSGSNVVALAEMASFQMEFKYLAHITTQAIYYQKAAKVNTILAASVNTRSGMIPDYFNSDDGLSRSDHFSVGAASDSAYEYLLKQYLLTAQMEPRTLMAYLETVDGVINNLLFLSPNRELLYITDKNQFQPSYTFEHLSCYFPGLLALGVMTLEDVLSEQQKQLHLWVSQGLTETCYLTYADQHTGLGPDIMQFGTDSKLWIDAFNGWNSTIPRDRTSLPPGLHGEDAVAVKDSTKRDYSNTTPNYLLRPETLESIYLMYEATGDELWRERGWEIFEAIETHTRTPSGYASIFNVDSPSGPHRINSMPSYFLAETLKYLYLLFQGNPNLLPLNKFVFNTEGHPLPIFRWSHTEIKNFGIDLGP